MIAAGGDCQFDWTENPLRVTPLCVALGIFPENIGHEQKTVLNGTANGPE